MVTVLLQQKVQEVVGSGDKACFRTDASMQLRVKAALAAIQPEPQAISIPVTQKQQQTQAQREEQEEDDWLAAICASPAGKKMVAAAANTLGEAPGARPGRDMGDTDGIAPGGFPEGEHDPAEVREEGEVRG
jgi:hypothetical protein